MTSISAMPERSKTKRISRLVLWALGVLLVLVVAGVSGLYAYAAIDKEDRFYVVDAQPLDADYVFNSDIPRPTDIEEYVGHRVHRLKRGRGLILAHRLYSNGNVGSIDDEYFRKITVWLPGGPPATEALYNLSGRANVLVLLSEGGSAWPRQACSGHVTAGTLRVARNGPRYRVSLHGHFAPHGNDAMFRRCKPDLVDIEFTAAQIQFSQLTPWLGSTGADNPYVETYR
jgi:hypothetical protein